MPRKVRLHLLGCLLHLSKTTPHYHFPCGSWPVTFICGDFGTDGSQNREGRMLMGCGISLHQSNEQNWGFQAGRGVRVMQKKSKEMWLCRWTPRPHPQMRVPNHHRKYHSQLSLRTPLSFSIHSDIYQASRSSAFCCLSPRWSLPTMTRRRGDRYQHGLRHPWGLVRRMISLDKPSNRPRHISVMNYPKRRGKPYSEAKPPRCKTSLLRCRPPDPDTSPERIAKPTSG